MCFLMEERCPDNPTLKNLIVEVHNSYRRSVQPPAANMLKMTYDDDVAASAQQWLDSCIIDHGPPSTRLIDGYEMGENLLKSTYNLKWDEVIALWHAEVANFQFPNISTNGKEIGHYTQVVWNSSYQVGCGVTKCGEAYFYGCQYYRAGNYIAWDPYQRGPPCAACPESCENKLCTNPCPYVNEYINCPELRVQFGCSNSYVSEWCPAACQCHDHIIPIYKK
ncbi:hypothetical protein NHX12_001251 [Muraenolepis orangiensis]|uniref:ShKT domain-containing protein n=1 Tax=Muraenolepis orangiensis TaxID=630683 RepID=A0A9Q0E0D3_9TELE|nr:hypothetical protein NHX12_001251 [Muraenolepis orangiensis]